jgi:hypothetical protein
MNRIDDPPRRPPTTIWPIAKRYYGWTVVRESLRYMINGPWLRKGAAQWMYSIG